MLNYLVVAILLVFSALFSGLTLGLMSLGAAELKRKMTLGNQDAAKVYAVRRRGNLLLTTLLVGNVAINSTLAIFLGSIASGLVAGVVSTSLIVVFGEITPQAIFSRYALSLGAKMAWLVQLFIFILYPLCAPIAWLLNLTLGEELATIYSKRELMKIVEEHRSNTESDVDADEARIIKGALTFSGKKVSDVMTPRTVVFMLEKSQVVDDALIEKLIAAGFSRIPIYDQLPDNNVGVLHIKRLMGLKDSTKTVADLMSKQIHFANEGTDLDTFFSNCLNSKHHLHVVQDEFGGFSGVITLEDVLEEIIMAEIVDETDAHPDLREFAVRKQTRESGE